MSTQETKLKDIADAIRAKEGSFDPIIANDFPARIAAIQTGTDTSDATATAGDILSGETAYVASGKVTGTIPTKTESNISVSGPTIIVPSGYYGSQVSKSIATATQATPTISVNSSGLITASSTQSAGYVTAGTKSATRQLTTQTGKTITPGRTQQTAVSSGRYTTGNVYVAGDTDLVAANIKKGVNIFGVAGTYEGASILVSDNPGSQLDLSVYSGQLSITVNALTSQNKILLIYLETGPLFLDNDEYYRSVIMIYDQMIDGRFYGTITYPRNETRLMVDGLLKVSNSGKTFVCKMDDDVGVPFGSVPEMGSDCYLVVVYQ